MLSPDLALAIAPDNTREVVMSGHWVDAVNAQIFADADRFVFSG